MTEACYTARATTKQQVIKGIGKLTLQTNEHGQYRQDAILLLQKGIHCVLVSRGSTRKNAICLKCLWTNSEYPNLLKSMLIWSLLSFVEKKWPLPYLWTPQTAFFGTNDWTSDWLVTDPVLALVPKKYLYWRLPTPIDCVVSRLDMYRTKVLMYHTMVLLARLTKVRR